MIQPQPEPAYVFRTNNSFKWAGECSLISPSLFLIWFKNVHTAWVVTCNNRALLLSADAMWQFSFSPSVCMWACTDRDRTLCQTGSVMCPRASSKLHNPGSHWAGYSRTCALQQRCAHPTFAMRAQHKFHLLFMCLSPHMIRQLENKDALLQCTHEPGSRLCLMF